jgi:hypothetical protein
MSIENNFSLTSKKTEEYQPSFQQREQAHPRHDFPHRRPKPSMMASMEQKK